MANTPKITEPTRFILVRHGESNVMVDGVVGGLKTCSGLSAKGQQQANLLGERFVTGSEGSIDIVYSSPLPRARETTEIVLRVASINHEINIHDDLEEFRLGEADGLTWEQVREKYELSDFEQRDPFVAIIPGADSRALCVYSHAGRSTDESLHPYLMRRRSSDGFGCNSLAASPESRKIKLG